MEIAAGKRIRVILMAIIGTAVIAVHWAFAERGTFYFQPILAGLLSVSLTGWVLLIGEAIPLLPPRRYYSCAGSEVQLYRRLGVPLFGRILSKGPCQFLIGRTMDASWDLKSLENVDRFTRKAEFLHLAALMVLLVPTTYWTLHGWWWGVFWLTFFNVLFNAYPIMLQRYNRVRLRRLFQNVKECGFALEGFMPKT